MSGISVFKRQAFALVHYLTEMRLGLNRLCVVDSTALTAHHRKEYLELAKRFHVPCVVFLFDVPLEKCIERDQGRQRTVGRPVIERQYLAFDQTKAAIRQEGFDEIIELRDEDLDKVQIEIIFRPIAQAAVTPVLRPQVTNRQAPHPWQQGAGRGSAVGGAKPFPTTQPAASSAAPVKPATRPGVASSNVTSAPATGSNQASGNAASSTSATSPLSSSESKIRTATSETATPPAKPLVKPDDQNPA